VHNQSYLGDVSVNGITDATLHPPSATPTHRTFARRIAHSIVSFPGVPIFMIKRDVSAAFKRVFLQVASTKYFASVVHGSSVHIDSNLAVVGSRCRSAGPAPLANTAYIKTSSTSTFPPLDRPGRT